MLVKPFQGCVPDTFTFPRISSVAIRIQSFQDWVFLNTNARGFGVAAFGRLLDHK
jgi:hypothetical protein